MEMKKLRKQGKIERSSHISPPTSHISGITLIALVVTIVILLILAGITINLALADDGIFGKAEEASEAQKKAEVRESIELMLADYSIEKATKNKDLDEYLNEQKEAKKLDEVINNEDGTITVEKDGYEITINIKDLSIEDIVKNVRAVRILLNKTVVKPEEEVTVTIEIVGEEIEKVLKWEFTDKSGNIGTEESSYTNDYTSNEIKLKQETEGTYYLHLLVEDKNGEKEEKISRAIKVITNPVTSIALDKTELTINKGETYTLTAIVAPDDADDKRVNWTSSDETVATIDETGKITTLKGGKTIIIAEAVDGSGVTASCEVTVVEILVTNITLNQTTATIDEGKTLKLTATIEPEDATNKTITWKSSNTSIVAVSTTEGSSGVAITVTGVKAGNATITATAKDGSGISASCVVTVVGATTTGTTHTATPLTYEWKEINEVAKTISDNYGTGTNQINNKTVEVTVRVNNKSYTVGVGDTMEVMYNNSTSCTVRIIGFNHDKLKNTGAYGGTNTYAGISFEFVDFLTGTTLKQMNTTNTNANGWAATKMRKDLNGYTTDSATQSGSIKGEGAKLSNSTYIKQVKKAYLPTYNSATLSTTPSQDYLWLLSCAEIWSTGSQTTGKGSAIGIEGNQYKWYTDHETGGTTSYSKPNSYFVKKPNDSGSATVCWLRSPLCSHDGYFCCLSIYGACGLTSASSSHGVAPGFCI